MYCSVYGAVSARAADDVEAFYKGKNIQVLNAFDQGGRYGVLARLVAAYLPRHLPGKPNGVPQFMPGAGGLLQTNHLFNVAAKDGTVIGLLYDSMPTAQVLEPANIRFDARRFEALGSINKGEPGVAAILKRTGVATVEDARKIPSVFGSTGSSGGAYVIPMIMNRMLGTRFKLIPGFKTTGHIFLAMDRGEVDGIYGAYEAVQQARPEWIAKNEVNVLAQLFDVRAAELPDVPLLQELATNDRDRAALHFLALARAPGKSFVAPPGVPPERLAALRAAFEAMAKDPEFKASLAKTEQVLEPRTWQDVTRIFRESIDVKPDILAYAKELMATK
jgi:tripartite-type tricarboxylate transporter receptor subunit TctC